LDAAQLIIIDEISMQDRYVLEFVDRQLRDISPKYSHLPFAGKAIVIGGDWKQLMPVIAGGNSEVQCSRSVKLSRLFRYKLITIQLSHFTHLSVFSKQIGSQ
jgi:ATP-dependent DNA helicase PIF1